MSKEKNDIIVIPLSLIIVKSQWWLSALTIQISRVEKNMNSQKIFYFEDQESLKMNLQSFLQEGDVILIKASNGMHFHLLVDFLKEMN